MVANEHKKHLFDSDMVDCGRKPDFGRKGKTHSGEKADNYRRETLRNIGHEKSLSCDIPISFQISWF
jgi:hypothetical protein